MELLINTGLAPLPTTRNVWGDVVLARDLPTFESVKAWRSSKKALFVRAVRDGVITREKFLRDYQALPEEFDRWKAQLKQHGLKGLKEEYRQPCSPNIEQYPSCSLQIGNVRVDLVAEKATVDEQPVHLSPSEFKIFSLLARRPGIVFSHEMILYQLYGANESSRGIKSLKLFVFKLRRKLEAKKV
ncbi:MAG: DUF1153 domain-containing protein, partial [Patescibacteria group bacterium]|nr:DUF1153 domain-containing protein [Patescibacteria group bacterium]